VEVLELMGETGVLSFGDETCYRMSTQAEPTGLTPLPHERDIYMYLVANQGCDSYKHRTVNGVSFYGDQRLMPIVSEMR